MPGGNLKSGHHHKRVKVAGTHRFVVVRGKKGEVDKGVARKVRAAHLKSLKGVRYSNPDKGTGMRKKGTLVNVAKKKSKISAKFGGKKRA